MDQATADSIDSADLRGLSAADVAERVAAGQTNAFSADSSRSAWNIVRANVFTLFNAIVAACFLVLLLLGRWQDALFGVAALSNAVIGCVQEFRAKAALDRLALLNAPRARVRREGVDTEIAPPDVVRDDLLVLRAGDQVPADAVVVDSRGLQIDESMLTGESDAVDKRPEDEALSGSIVVAGEGTARVVRVGSESYANTFAAEAKRFQLVSSELRTSVDRVLKWVGWGIGPIGLLVLNAQMMVAGGWVQAWQQGTWQQAVVNTIASLTAMIPLGLVLMTSIAFAVGAARLAGQKVLVNELPAVEGLARVDVICLDKTGTLTAGEIRFDDVLTLEESAGWRTALAWYGAAADANATAKCLREPFPLDEPIEAARRIPFSSARKWSAVSFASGGTWILGAPEMVFGDLAADASSELGAAVTRLASSGRRTLVLAHSGAALDDIDVEEERLPAAPVAVAVLTFVEAVRPDAADALAYFREQGVGVRVISGDNPRTVAAIAREVGLEVDEGYDARRLPEDDAELGLVLEQHNVFGRVTPDQKRRMVTALQARGHVVAMTGDGVNDALAIKTADIGIAMNSGAAATKAVARLVLLDGRFSHLPSVVAEGRQVIANIERVSMLFLTKTVYATGLAVLFGALVMEFPFLPRQLSITDGLTIGIPAFFLALLPNTQRYVPGFLRRSLSFAIPAGLVIAVSLTLYTRVAMSIGLSVEQLRTGATIILAIVAIWVLTVLSRPVTRVKVLVIGAMFIALTAIFTVPALGEFFQLRDPGEDGAAVITVVVVVAIGAIEVVRFAHRRFVRRSLVARSGGRPDEIDDATATSARRRPSAVSAAIVLVYVGGFINTALGIVVLLARYGVPDDLVLPTSLVGAATVLLGLLTVAGGSALSRGSALARNLLTAYLALLGVLQAVAMILTELDPVLTVALVAAVAVIIAIWVPAGSRRWFHPAPAGRGASTPSG
ncbi:cation-transporting ATPase E [Microbacterium proteolyticum]|uniref:Cation-transporting ATPase E n=1 Tax=Microbacterium proteolyticum TaxID=1572644 RepID=A0A7W5CHI5_9MICO|nr:HAD-IC family P-type ATPase [Microbacterium proteolyticum]MBB3157788.1 cation-transporting ATPase E [Microbacterium proteolyticum]